MNGALKKPRFEARAVPFVGWFIVLALILTAVPLAAAFAADGDENENAGRDRMRGRPLAMTTPSGLRFQTGPNVVVERGPADDIFAAGGGVTATSITADSFFAAGGAVSLSSSEVRDAIIAGGNISISAVRAEDVIAAGGAVDIDAQIADDLIAAGGAVRLNKASRAGGDAVLSGGRIELDGTVGGDAVVNAGTIVMSGTIEGSAELNARDIRLLPGARIGGDLKYRGREDLEIPVDVTIVGKIERLGPAPGALSFRPPVGAVIAAGFAAWLGFGVAIFVLAAFVLAAAPHHTDQAVARMRERTLESLGLGVAIGAAGPTLLVILFVSLIGLPLGIVLGALYVAAMGVAVAIACYWGGLFVRTKTHRSGAVATWRDRAAWAAVGTLGFMLIGLVPFAGGLVQAAAVLVALGAGAAVTWTMRGRPASAA